MCRLVQSGNLGEEEEAEAAPRPKKQKLAASASASDSASNSAWKIEEQCGLRNCDWNQDVVYMYYKKLVGK